MSYISFWSTRFLGVHVVLNVVFLIALYITRMIALAPHLPLAYLALIAVGLNALFFVLSGYAYYMRLRYTLTDQSSLSQDDFERDLENIFCTHGRYSQVFVLRQNDEKIPDGIWPIGSYGHALVLVQGSTDADAPAGEVILVRGPAHLLRHWFEDQGSVWVSRAPMLGWTNYEFKGKHNA